MLNLESLKIDLFSYSPNLSFNGKRVHKSIFGIIMTYSYIALTILAFIDFGGELVVRKNPIVTVKEIKNSNLVPPRINMNPKDIAIAVGIFQNEGLIPLDETYFSVSGKQLVIKTMNEFGQFQFIEQIFPMVKCTPDRIPAGSRYINDSSNIYLCMDDKFQHISSNLPFNRTALEGKGLYLNGFFGANEYVQIIISFSRCQNKTNSTTAPVCQSPEEIDRKISQVYIGGTFLNKYLDLQDYSDPFRSNLEWFYSKPNSNFKKEMQLFFQKQTLTTDEGWLINREEDRDFFVMSDKREFIENSDSDLSLFMSFSFQIDSVQKNYTRRYKKIQDLAAEVGGIMKVLLLVLTLIMRPIGLESYKKEFVQSVFGGNISYCSRRSTNLKKRIKNLFCKQAREIQKNDTIMLSRAYDFIDEKLDLKNLFNKVIEIERLSQIIFESYQYVLFKNYCSNQRWIDSNELDLIRLNRKKSTFDSRLADYHSTKFMKNFKQALKELKRKDQNYERIIDQNFKIMLKKELDEMEINKLDSENFSSSKDIYEFVQEKGVPRESCFLVKSELEFSNMKKS